MELKVCSATIWVLYVIKAVDLEQNMGYTYILHCGQTYPHNIKISILICTLRVRYIVKEKVEMVLYVVIYPAR